MSLKRIIRALGFLGTLPSIAHAQGAGIEWDILNQEVMELYRAGRYDRAVMLAQKALQVAEQNVGPDHPAVATSLNNLASLYHTQGDYAKAEPLYKRALAILEKALGPDHPDVATSLNNLAWLYRTQGDFRDAYKKLVAGAERVSDLRVGWGGNVSYLYALLVDTGAVRRA